MSFDTAGHVSNELQAAVRTIYLASAGDVSGEPLAIVRAHHTLAKRGPSNDRLGRAVERYLDPASWHSGPVALEVVIHQLACVAGVKTSPPRQLSLF
jgi:hypothetical protein